MNISPRPKRSVWWRSNTAGLTLLCILLVAAVIVLLYGVEWSGLQGKTVWDWLELIIVPLVLAGGGLFLQRIESERVSRQEKLEKQREERQIAREKQQARDSLMDSIFQSYLDDMSSLMIVNHLQTMLDIVTLNSRQKTALSGNDALHEGYVAQLRQKLSSQESIDSEKLAAAVAVVTVARARTVTAFNSLDVDRRNLMTDFLRETGLVTGEQGTLLVDMGLSHMDLSGTNFYKFNLAEANLINSDLSEANFFQANLIHANLHGANLSGADIGDTDLHFVDLGDAYLKNAHLENVRFNEKTALPDALPIRWNEDYSIATYDKYWSERIDWSRYTDNNHRDFWKPKYLTPEYQESRPIWATRLIEKETEDQELDGA
ncbi:MAG: pentapeptide repeat-containing protein [Anaerolineae bacterium]|nr:pentapeptide repeat-containing protein [Anaerolineae bacterium]